MAEIPSANITVEDESAGAGASGTGYLAIFAAVPQSDDIVPRVFSSWKGIYSQHGYSPGLSLAASFLEETRKSVIFVGLPIETQGAVGRVDDSGVTGTSAVSVSAGADGALEEAQGIVTVSKGGTIGTDQILLTLSLDNGETSKKVRLGTASSYVIPYIGVTLSFGAGTLVAGDVFTFVTTAPKWDGAGITAARQALAAQNKLVRTILPIGEVSNSTEAHEVLDEVNAYETSNQRFTMARVQVRDRLPHAVLSSTTKRMTGSPSLTFAEVGSSGDTITRSAGSWITDGFVVGDVITVSNSASNNVTGPIASLSATVITLGTTDLVDEGPVAGCSVVAHEGMTFAEVGGTGDTITRSRGSWLGDGFRVGDTVTVAGTSSNNVTGAIADLSDTVLTFGSTDLAAEVIGANAITITTGETKAAWVSAMDTAFAAIDAQKRISLGLSKRRKKCPVTGWFFRRPVHWAATLREYSLRDIHISTWRKSDGPLSGWGGASDDSEEYDERTDGGALAARFTCFRSWGNGPEGAFIAQDLTRADENSNLSLTHNLEVTNLACTTCQTATEDAVGESLILNKNGTATAESLGLIEGRVNKAIQLALLQDNGEGPRASSAVWVASRTDVLNVPNATLHGVLTLLLRGTLVHIDTSVVVPAGGA